MADVQELLKSMRAEKDALLAEKEKGATGDASILQEFNLRRLNREMNLLCNEYDTLVTQNASIEEKLTQLESNPPRCVLQQYQVTMLYTFCSITILIEHYHFENLHSATFILYYIVTSYSASYGQV